MTLIITRFHYSPNGCVLIFRSTQVVQSRCLKNMARCFFLCDFIMDEVPIIDTCRTIPLDRSRVVFIVDTWWLASTEIGLSMENAVIVLWRDRMHSLLRHV